MKKRRRKNHSYVLIQAELIVGNTHIPWWCLPFNWMDKKWVHGRLIILSYLTFVLSLTFFVKCKKKKKSEKKIIQHFTQCKFCHTKGNKRNKDKTLSLIFSRNFASESEKLNYGAPWLNGRKYIYILLYKNKKYFLYHWYLLIPADLVVGDIRTKFCYVYLREEEKIYI